jgi:hypothetical protein
MNTSKSSPGLPVNKVVHFPSMPQWPNPPAYLLDLQNPFPVFPVLALLPEFLNPRKAIVCHPGEVLNLLLQGRWPHMFLHPTF